MCVCKVVLSVKFLTEITMRKIHELHCNGTKLVLMYFWRTVFFIVFPRNATRNL